MRSLTGTGMVVVALTATVAAILFPIWTYDDRSGTGLANLRAGSVPTAWGPLSAADRDFVVRVRLAGLWELPAGQQAVARAPSVAVRTAGEHLVHGHTYLDARVREVAKRLSMELPSQPTAQQLGWLEEFTAARGLEYETKFANILRRAHGKVFSLVADIRASTRNTLVRGLADDANTTVLDHIKVLEATGLVDFDAVAADSAATSTASPTGPPPPVPGATPPPAGALTPTPPSSVFPLPPPVSRPRPTPQPDQSARSDRSTGRTPHGVAAGNSRKNRPCSRSSFCWSPGPSRASAAPGSASPPSKPPAPPPHAKTGNGN
jgi:predicted outer membrane protein